MQRGWEALSAARRADCANLPTPTPLVFDQSPGSQSHALLAQLGQSGVSCLVPCVPDRSRPMIRLACFAIYLVLDVFADPEAAAVRLDPRDIHLPQITNQETQVA